ncbi:caspase family protein, partial [Candidatus Parcubacteria bacterium]
MSDTFSTGYAVIIGVGADLPVTVQDARGVASILTDPTRCAYPSEHVRLLTAEEATVPHIRAALDWLAQVTGPDDTAMVYFSGHGVETPDYYLIPYGYDLADLRRTAISGHEFTDNLGRIEARKLLV